MAITGRDKNYEDVDLSNERRGNQQLQERVRSLISFVREQLGTVAQHHKQLARSRDQLIMQREQFRMLARTLHVEREKTATAEDSFMNKLRQFHSDGTSIISASIEESYQAVQKAREELGAAENDWIQAERNLGGAEWVFLEKEENFYRSDLIDRFSDDFFEEVLRGLNCQSQTRVAYTQEPTTAPASLLREELDSEILGLEILRKEFDSLRGQQARYLEQRREHKLRQLPLSLLPKQDLQFVRRYEDLLARITDSEVKIMQLKENTNLLGNVFETRSRIKEWLWEYLKSNAVQKTQYREILKHWGNTDIEDSWEDRANEYWDVDITDGSPEDDLVQPDDSVSQHVSEPAGSEQGKSMDQPGIDNDPYENLNNTQIPLNFEDNFDHGAVFPGPLFPEAFHPGPPSPGFGLVQSFESFYDSAEEFAGTPPGMIPWGKPDPVSSQGGEQIPDFSLDVPPPPPPPPPPAPIPTAEPGQLMVPQTNDQPLSLTIHDTPPYPATEPVDTVQLPNFQSAFALHTFIVDQPDAHENEREKTAVPAGPSDPPVQQDYRYEGEDTDNISTTDELHAERCTKSLPPTSRHPILLNDISFDLAEENVVRTPNDRNTLFQIGLNRKGPDLTVVRHPSRKYLKGGKVLISSFDVLVEI
ncbi:hypothetical protein GQ43DRAFT_469478 [Delitschia confertaspora ATCC 74209]|uniref:Uncharacterized protein n=1 Tax=Delitschia confertaspora ATCC 74209 TaxID=1513339 RepID=A0A9P4MUU3_9PLEO|nr:hypothetical protein GQ43DRAFT_469478 [Delitschia confertaspora ATCC 74209]